MEGARRAYFNRRCSLWRPTGCHYDVSFQMTKRRSVSIVTPVYNGADYLEECLDSVLAQTLKDWDLAIVDNASTDKTPIIAERYARRDPRIRHVRFEDHVDLPANVNRAYLQVNPDSTWCKPLMADDWLYPNCIEQMVTAGEELDSIGLVTSYQRQGDYVLLTQVPYDQKVVPGRSVIAQNLVTGANVTGGPTAQMYKTSLVLRGGVFLEMGLEHDDTDAAFRILLDYDLGFVHQVLTYVRRQGERRTDRALQMGSDLTEQLLFIVRYGPAGSRRATLSGGLASSAPYLHNLASEAAGSTLPFAEQGILSLSSRHSLEAQRC